VGFLLAGTPCIFLLLLQASIIHKFYGRKMTSWKCLQPSFTIKPPAAFAFKVFTKKHFPLVQAKRHCRLNIYPLFFFSLVNIALFIFIHPSHPRASWEIFAFLLNYHHSLFLAFMFFPNCLFHRDDLTLIATPSHRI
jgi:hypothetical protein